MGSQNEFVTGNFEMGNRHHTAFRAERIIDPVCGMEVDEKEAHHQFEHKATTYFFCTPKCRMTFEGNPEKFIRLLRFASNEW